MTPARSPSPCPNCGVRAARVNVHGHVQCARCRTVLGPCCEGASAGDEVQGECAAALSPGPDLFRRLFAERLGGARATVTTAALRFALVENRSTDLEGADLLLEAALRTGVLVLAGEGCCRLPD
ncbi:MAG: hypothetical protein KDC98_20190 [Planctomycetes bacterium]|nr:hypothetical protein [Planctomycetota bacterium]